MATAEQLSRYRTQTSALITLAHRDLTQFWRSLNVAGNPLTVRDALLAFFPELVQVYGDVAALLGADFYDELRNAPPSSARFNAALASPADTGQAVAAARWGLGPLFSNTPDTGQALTNLLGSAQRLVMQPARTSIFDSARTDPFKTGFARVTVGATCEWCTMLASRGFAYRSDESAGAFNDWHDDCDCMIVPGRGWADLP